MKRITIIILTLSLTSCASMFLEKALEKVGIFDDKAMIENLEHSRKNLLFIGMHHIGRKEFYDDVSKKVDSLQNDGFVVYYEFVKKNETNDSITNDIYKKKLRKLTGLKNTKYYDSLTKKIGGKYKYKGDFNLMNQPKYMNLGVDMKTAINADVEVVTMIDEFEIKYGEIILDECDLNTKSNSTEYECDKLNSELSNKFNEEYILNFRNKYLADEINSSSHNKILVIYGKNHLEGLSKELLNINGRIN